MTHSRWACLIASTCVFWGGAVIGLQISHRWHNLPLILGPYLGTGFCVVRWILSPPEGTR